ncbi:hypothetical protein [Metasolibacillus meyeri]|uniref:hypothetical protein n=1 Tax=Metasolibacillus meyeri TaxID=1071052 RepID=UPI000D3189D2|nr:hypothetical protein [Metasolibacillus meyeri]
MNTKKCFNQREFNLSISDIALSIQKILLIQVKPPADVTDFEEEFFERARKKSGRNYAKAQLIMLSLSLIAAFTLSTPATLSSVQAAENLEPVITQAEDKIFVTRIEPTNVSAIWVTETRNGKTYSGYIYNRGSYGGGKYIFNGYIHTGSHANPYVLENH